jgi:hypothetical protein
MVKSKRAQAWEAFAAKVSEHIENYTVPQYGDEGADSVTEYNSRDCMIQCKKYQNRFGTNQREGQQELDFMKIAHYAQLAHQKWLDEQGLTE